VLCPYIHWIFDANVLIKRKKHNGIDEVTYNIQNYVFLKVFEVGASF